MADLCIIPASASTEGYVELAKQSGSGVRFRKHILNLGPLHYNGKTFNLDEDWYGQVQRNFDSGVSMCQVPVADGKNRHTEDPLRNAGEVVGLEREGNKVYTVIDVRSPKVVEGLRNKTIMGASAMLHMNYRDTRSDKLVGPTLLHHCITNRPHVLDLEPYQEVVSATCDLSADMDFDDPIVLSTEDDVPELTKDELITQLRTHGIDVPALEAAAAAKVDLTAITDALKGAGTLQLSGESLTESDIVGSIVELARKNESLGEDVLTLKKKDAVREVDAFISAGRLLPKSKDKAVAMYLSNPQDLDDFLAPEDEPIIRMSEQSGIEGEGEAAAKHNFDVAKETERLAGMANSLGGSGKARK